LFGKVLSVNCATMRNFILHSSSLLVFTYFSLVHWKVFFKYRIISLNQFPMSNRTDIRLTALFMMTIQFDKIRNQGLNRPKGLRVFLIYPISRSRSGLRFCTQLCLWWQYNMVKSENMGSIGPKGLGPLFI